MKFVDTAFSGANNRNKPMELSAVKGLDLSKYEDCYNTYMRFDESFKDYVLKTGTVKEYDGFYTSDFLPFDIDFENDLLRSKEEAETLVNRLQVVYDLCNSDTEIFFSGAKGFHIQIPQQVFGGFTPSKDLAQVFKRMAMEIASGLEIDTAIYDTMRLWRIPNTKNSKTGLYKISLSVQELYELSIDKIKELAKTPREILPSDPTVRPKLVELYNKCKVTKTISKPIDKVTLYPKGEKRCVYNILNNVVPDGERNNALMRLAVYFKGRFTQSNLTALLKSWNSDNGIGLPDDEIERTIISAMNEYDFGCNDGLLMKYCDKDCSYHLRKKDELQNIVDIKYMENRYIDYIRKIDDLKLDLSKWLPSFHRASRGITAGEVVMMIAGSGVGKTAFLQNLLYHMKCPTMFFSYELPEILTYERFYQILNNCEGEKVESDYEFGTPDNLILHETFKDAYFNFSPDVKIDDIPSMVALVEEKKHIKIKITAIDYLGLVKGGQGSRYERVSYIAEKLKDIAKKTNSVVFCLAQVSRQQGALGQEDLTITSGKDSGSIENTGDLVLGLSRPFKDNVENDNVIRIAILKNRKGEDGTKIDCLFDKKTLRIKEMPVI